ncbi:YcfL family protein [Helicobacter ibis]|uniref:YcfL family protein n=1 Tax=Helicobacter ibis TaxID=2962633 RepID=A0ABT4VFT3_9HELI|nr:YcfL family protein [Helicobacter ibis]MDA3969587.1 YcfL family protein [Helicobacter ibis]
MRYVFLLACILFFSACGGVTYTPAPHTKHDRVFIDSSLPKDIVKNLREIKNLNGLLEFDLILRSSTNRDIIYKVTWLDENGLELPNVIDDEYRTIRILANKDKRIKKVAQHKSAKDFKIYIQRK